MQKKNERRSRKNKIQKVKRAGGGFLVGRSYGPLLELFLKTVYSFPISKTCFRNFRLKTVFFLELVLKARGFVRTI